MDELKALAIRKVAQQSAEEQAWWVAYLGWKTSRTLAMRPAYWEADAATVLLSEIERRDDVARLVASGIPVRPREVALRPRLPPRVAGMPNAPFCLWCDGDRALIEQDHIRVGVIGSRHPRPDSAHVASTIAEGLARAGVTVVSGMAIGIDGIAHRAALQARGSTIAVLANGIHHPHPSRHRSLARQIASSGGLLVSEYHPATPARRHRFRERNRIIAGLSDLLVVIQAGERSGSMVTARFAQEAGVDIAVVPSSIGDPAYEGSLQLLRDGARAVVDAGTVLRAIGVEAPGSAEQHGFGSILDVPRTADDVAALSGLDLTATLAELLELELSGLVERMPDGRYVNAVISAVH